MGDCASFVFGIAYMEDDGEYLLRSVFERQSLKTDPVQIGAAISVPHKSPAREYHHAAKVCDNRIGAERRG